VGNHHQKNEFQKEVVLRISELQQQPTVVVDATSTSTHSVTAGNGTESPKRETTTNPFLASDVFGGANFMNENGSLQGISKLKFVNMDQLLELSDSFGNRAMNSSNTIVPQDLEVKRKESENYITITTLSTHSNLKYINIGTTFY